MQFKRLKPGLYQAQVESPRMYISVFREGRGQWYWHLWGIENGLLWETDDVGPFPKLKEAVDDATASYEDYIELV